MKTATPGLDPESVSSSASHSLVGLLRIAWQHKVLVALGLTLGVIGGSLYYAEQPQVYASRAQLLVVKKNADALPVPATDIRYDFDDYLTTHIALIKSPLVVGRAVKEYQLGELPAFAGGGDPTSAIISALSASRDTGDSKEGTSKILNLSYRSSSAETCRKVLEAVIKSYQEILSESYRDVGLETYELIEKARRMLEKDLVVKEKAYWEFREKSPLVLTSKDRINIHQQRLASIEAKRSALLVTQAELEAKIAALETALKHGVSEAARSAILAHMSRGTATDVSGSNASAGLKDQFVGLLLQEQKLLDDYGPDHPRVQALHRSIQLLRGLMEPSATNPVLRPEVSPEQYLEILKQELQDTRAAAQSLKELFDQEDAQAKKLANFEMQEEQLRADRERTQQLYDTILKRLQEVRLLKDAGGFNAQILWPPSDGSKIGPQVMRILSLSALLGLLGGFCLAYLFDRSDTRFRTPEEIHERLGVPVIGHIPVLTLQEPREGEAAESDLDPILISHYQSRSVEAEAYRGVRTALYFMTYKQGMHVIQVSSPNGADGKTTLTANLAVSIAQAGMKCIVVDADFRKPKIHKLFGVANDVGLASVVTDGANLGKSISTCDVPGLAVLPCGPLPPNPAEVLMAPQFGDALQALRQRYDYVLIDSPPLLAVTDPGIISPRVDGTLLVLRPGNNNRAAAQRAKDILAGLGGKLLGVVVNGTGSRDKGTQYNYSHYGTGQDYGYTDYYES
jgi:capsular exopolysaccharide synthesis family protein